MYQIIDSIPAAGLLKGDIISTDAGILTLTSVFDEMDVISVTGIDLFDNDVVVKIDPYLEINLLAEVDDKVTA